MSGFIQYPEKKKQISFAVFHCWNRHVPARKTIPNSTTNLSLVDFNRSTYTDKNSKSP